MLRPLLLLSLVLVLTACAPSPLPPLPRIEPTAVALAPASPSTSTPEPTTTPTRPPTNTLVPTRATTTPTATPVPPTPTPYFIRFTATPTRGTRTPRPTRETFRPTSDLTLLMPDLRMLPPVDFMIETTPENRRLLRLTNYVMNFGPGRLEILGESDPVTARTVVTQHVFRANGSYTERPAGIFIFHPAHDHWHLENFARYEVWSLTPEGGLDKTVALAAKVSYCLRDTGRSTLPNTPPDPLYTECLAKLQGINTGWIDSYQYDIPDQTVDITDLEDGVYAVRCIVDPGDLFLEANEQNNSSLSYIHVTGDTVRELDRPQAIAELDAAQ